MNNTTTVQFLGRQFLVTIKSLFSGCSDCFHGLLCPVSWEGKEVCDCFWEFDGWRTYWHNYCRTQPLFLSSSFKMEERAAAVLAGFYPVFSSFNLFPFLYFSPFSFISNNFVSIYTVLYIPSTTPPLPTHLSMTVFKVHLLPSLPLPSLFAESRAVSSSATQGPVHTREEKTTSVLPTMPRQCFVFQFRKKYDFIWRLSVLSSFWFSMLQETQTPVCVSGLATKKELLLWCWNFFFFCIIIYRS